MVGASRVRGASTVHSYTIGRTAAADTISSCTLAKRSGRRTTGILVAEAVRVSDAEWRRLLEREVIASLVGAVLLTLIGAALGGLIARPVRRVAAAARASASGTRNVRVAPDGPAEVRDMAVALNSMMDEVERRQRLDHDLLANMSHELAAPLGLIQGYAEGLADGMIDGEELRTAALRAITDEAERLKTLSGNLLDLALLETGEVQIHREEVPIDELLTNLASRFNPAAQQQGVILRVDVPLNLPRIHTDGLRLEQVLVNLLNNALRHTSRDGAITISARPASGGVNVAVADTGVGIPPDDLARIWERFYQVNKGRGRQQSGRGLGLGLAISQSTVHALGGRIDVESVVGAGTTFRIWLPLRLDHA